MAATRRSVIVIVHGANDAADPGVRDVRARPRPYVRVST